jgi:hypothetical protein
MSGIAQPTAQVRGTSIAEQGASMSDRIETSAQTPSLQALSEEFEQLLARGAGLLDRTGAVEAQLIGHRIAPLLDVSREEEGAAALEFDWPPSAEALDDCEVVPLGQDGVVLGPELVALGERILTTAHPEAIVREPEIASSSPDIEWAELMAEPSMPLDTEPPEAEVRPPAASAPRGWGWWHVGLASAAAVTGIAAATITLLVEPSRGAQPANQVSQWQPVEVPVAAAERHPAPPMRTLAPPIVVEAPMAVEAPSVDEAPSRAPAPPDDARPDEAPRVLVARHEAATVPALEPAVLSTRSGALPPPAAAVPVPSVHAGPADRSIDPEIRTVGAAVAPLASSMPSNANVPSAPLPAVRPSHPVMEPVDAGPDERERITSTLGRFRTAYAELDARAAQAVWPTVDVEALERAFGGLKQQELTFERCTVEVTGRDASAQCRGRATYVGRVGRQTPHTATRQWDFQLRKADSGWTIASARIR